MVSFDIQEVYKSDATLHVNGVKHRPIFQFRNSNDNLQAAQCVLKKTENVNCTNGINCL